MFPIALTTPGARHNGTAGLQQGSREGIYPSLCPTTITRACCEALVAHLEGDEKACQRWFCTVERWDSLDGDKVVRARWLAKVLGQLR